MESAEKMKIQLKAEEDVHRGVYDEPWDSNAERKAEKKVVYNYYWRKEKDKK